MSANQPAIIAREFDYTRTHYPRASVHFSNFRKSGRHDLLSIIFRPLPKRGSPGEYGQPVFVNNPTPDEEKLIEDGWQRQEQGLISSSTG